jgi:hypothetical protein
MEILLLVLLYYLSQNPDFHEKLKPLATGLKDSEQMLAFLKDLSKFASVFKDVNNPECKKQPPVDKKAEEKCEEKPQSPTSGIADDFIQKMLDGYLKK